MQTGLNSVQGKTPSELNGKTSQGGLPIADGQRPFFADVVECQVEEFQQRLIAWKRAPILGQLVRAHIQGLDGISRVDACV